LHQRIHLPRGYSRPADSSSSLARIARWDVTTAGYACRSAGYGRRSAGYARRSAGYACRSAGYSGYVRACQATSVAAAVRTRLRSELDCGQNSTAVRRLRSDGCGRRPSPRTTTPQPSPMNSTVGDFTAYTAVNAPTTAGRRHPCALDRDSDGQRPKRAARPGRLVSLPHGGDGDRPGRRIFSRIGAFPLARPPHGPRRPRPVATGP
jgi:hypothetical protein